MLAHQNVVLLKIFTSTEKFLHPSKILSFLNTDLISFYEYGIFVLNFTLNTPINFFIPSDILDLSQATPGRWFLLAVILTGYWFHCPNHCKTVGLQGNTYSYTLGREYRVLRNWYSRLLFTSEDRLCANLRMQEQSTNMTSQCQCPTFAWLHTSTVVTSQY